MNATVKLRNIGPKSAAWLRQVGLRTQQDLSEVGAVEAFVRVKRAGFKPSLNLLYALEGALLGCHWQELPLSRREQIVAELEAAVALLPPPRGRPAAAPVATTHFDHEDASDVRDIDGGMHRDTDMIADAPGDPGHPGDPD